MKKKYYLTATMFLLMALVMAAQPMSKQRACDVVKMDLQKGKTFTMYANKNVSETQQQSSFRLYTSQQSPRLNENESSDSATVTLKYNLQTEEFGRYYVHSVMVYNPDWSALGHPDMTTPDGSFAEGIIIKVPHGIYDLYTNTLNFMNNKHLIHIDELVNINKDTTIFLNVIDAENIVYAEFKNKDNEPLTPRTIRPISEYPGYLVVEEGNIYSGCGYAPVILQGYGVVSQLTYGITGKMEGEIYPMHSYYINNLSDRYQLCIIEQDFGKDGISYLNKRYSDGFSTFPLTNDVNDYTTYEELFQVTPKAIEAGITSTIGASQSIYIDNSREWEIEATIEEDYSPISENYCVKTMINAPKNGDIILHGINVAEILRIHDLDGYIYSPEFMVNENQNIQFLINNGNVKTSEIKIWKEDYPPHPKFSYTNRKKKGIMGNCCPLNIIISNNQWYQIKKANIINMYNIHKGRNGEQFNANVYSTMTAKYNGDEIYSGKFALDSLSWAWCGTQPDGTYELKFTNTNVAVDDIPGKNVTTVYFDQTKEDWNSPVLKMLQFRDGENNVTDRFEIPTDGTIMFAGGDFDPRSTPYIDENGNERAWEYEECQPMAVEVSYAPYGTDDWQPLEGIEHQSEFDDIPGMGFFYSGSLASVSVPSENKWYDLKFRLVDESGNWQEQIVSPAFKIESLVPEAITEVINGDATEVARYSVDGRRITSPEPGINIVEMSDGTTHKVLVK